MIPVVGNAVSYYAPGGDTSAPSGATVHLLHAPFTASTTLRWITLQQLSPCVANLLPMDPESWFQVNGDRLRTGKLDSWKLVIVEIAFKFYQTVVY